MNSTSSINGAPINAWREVEVAGSKFYIHRHRVDGRILVFNAFEPSSINGPHVDVLDHPSYGPIAKIVSRRLPENLQADVREAQNPATAETLAARADAIEAFREPLRILAHAVLTTGLPELQGFRIDPSLDHIEISIH